MSIITDQQFREAYENFIAERFVYSTASLENMPDEYWQGMLKINILLSYKYLLNKEDSINVGDIQRIADRINQGTNTPTGFRKIEVDPGIKANFIPAKSNQIVNELNSLLINYYYVWKDIDPFLKEAMFHIKYIRIHPFEDGNKRSGKLIMATNLFKQKIIPPIITKSDTDKYYELINNQDYEGFAEFLREKSSLENNILCGYYKSLTGTGVIDNIDGDEIKKKVLK